jgi:aryl-alcohol dehydrogenase-like predicted oxidoreductase
MSTGTLSAPNPDTNLHPNGRSLSSRLSLPGSHRSLDAARRWQRGSISPFLLSPDPFEPRPLAGPIERVRLGRSPAHVSRVIFGSMAIGSARHDHERRIQTIRAALDAGITSIDSAPMYDLGACERTVGEAIRGVRGKVQILSKVGLRWDDPHGKILFTARNEHGRLVAVRKNSRPESVRLEVERSLERLGVDVLDTVHVHMRDPGTPIEDTMGALKDLMHEGKLRAIGVSTHFGPREIARAQRALGEVPLASIQLCYNLLDRHCEADLLPVARAGSVAVLARSPLAMGLLTGRIGPWWSFSDSDLRRTMPRFHRDNLRRVSIALQRGIAPIAADRGVSIATVALAWVLNRPVVSAIVVGASDPRQAYANAEAADLKLGTDEEGRIQKAFEGIVLDPYAGLGFLGRALARGRRLARAVERRRAD